VHVGHTPERYRINRAQSKLRVTSAPPASSLGLIEAVLGL
jgi:hypothetical protein